MMRALAEYILRGRVQAVCLALLGIVVPFISQATVALVTLKKGWQEGLIIALWACLPYLVAPWLYQEGVTVVMATCLAILLSVLAGWILRYTVSWPAALMAIVAAASAAAMAVGLVAPDLTESFRGMVEQIGKQQDADVSDQLQAMAEQWERHHLLGLVAWWLALSSVVGLVIGRWWHAMVDNPGGFRREFHRLRLNQTSAVACGGALIWSLMAAPQYEFWGRVFTLPLLLSGLGALHCVVARFRAGVAPLVVLYALVVLLPPVAFMVSLTGLTDAWVDYRKRFNLMQSRDDCDN